MCYSSLIEADIDGIGVWIRSSAIGAVAATVVVANEVDRELSIELSAVR